MRRHVSLPDVQNCTRLSWAEMAKDRARHCSAVQFCDVFFAACDPSCVERRYHVLCCARCCDLFGGENPHLPCDRRPSACCASTVNCRTDFGLSSLRYPDVDSVDPADPLSSIKVIQRPIPAARPHPARPTRTPAPCAGAYRPRSRPAGLSHGRGRRHCGRGGSGGRVRCSGCAAPCGRRRAAGPGS